MWSMMRFFVALLMICFLHPIQLIHCKNFMKELTSRKANETDINAYKNLENHKFFNAVRESAKQDENARAPQHPEINRVNPSVIGGSKKNSLLSYDETLPDITGFPMSVAESSRYSQYPQSTIDVDGVTTPSLSQIDQNLQLEKRLADLYNSYPYLYPGEFGYQNRDFKREPFYKSKFIYSAPSYKNFGFKKAAGMNSAGFHGDIFTDGFGAFSTMKRSKTEQNFSAPKLDLLDLVLLVLELQPYFTNRSFDVTRKIYKSPSDFDVLKLKDPGVNNFEHVAKIKGFYKKILRNDIKDLKNMKKKLSNEKLMGFTKKSFSNGFSNVNNMNKKNSDRNWKNFYGHTSSNGFGDFITMKKKFSKENSMGFHGDTFTNGFGDFNTMKKKFSGGSAMGFHGDTFTNGFGDFNPMKKKFSGANSMGFHGDTFSNGFGDFNTMKKKFSGGNSMGFHGDTFTNGFGDFSTMKKKFAGRNSIGFHGDTFTDGFGDFETM